MMKDVGGEYNLLIDNWNNDAIIDVKIVPGTNICGKD